MAEVEPSDSLAPPLPELALPLPPTEGPARFAFIDALRGIAAFVVMIYHFYTTGPLHGVYESYFPNWANSVVAKLNAGVLIFFVLSGYVMAYSIRGTRVTGRFFANFALRRSLRLDPPYWLAMLILLLVDALSNRLLPMRHADLPSPGTFLLNMFYLQAFVGRPVLQIAWTLCIEVQFYVVLVVATGAAQRMGKRRALGWPSLGEMLLWTGMFLGSLYLRDPKLGLEDRLFLSFPPHWYMFFLGVLAWRVLNKEVAEGWFWLFAALTAAAGAYRPGEPAHIVVVIGTAVLIFIVGRVGKLHSLLDWRWLQFLGAISYGTYLFHEVIGVRVINLGFRFTRDRVAVAWVLMPLGIAATLTAAWLMRRFVEAPFIRIAKRFKHVRGEPAERLPTIGQ